MSFVSNNYFERIPLTGHWNAAEELSKKEPRLKKTTLWLVEGRRWNLWTPSKKNLEV